VATFIGIALVDVLTRVGTAAQEQKWEQIGSRTPAAIQQQQVQAMLRRLMPEHHAQKFLIKIDSSFAPKNKDYAEVVSFVRNQEKTSSHDNANNNDHFNEESVDEMIVEIQIRANTGVAASLGLHKYLKEYCNSHVSWEFIRIALPDSLPEANFTVTTNDKFRYLANVCTFGYTYAFWDWSRWERHIDWMALSGINLPLAFTAQELIWKRVWNKYGVTDQQLDGYFVGPAFLPWQRMGNVNSIGGPLTPNWHSFTRDLQHKILERMRGLGMTPVLPAFAGYVPPEFATMHPESKFHKEIWSPQLGSTLLLDPQDPLFEEIGADFLLEYAAEFGETDHVYNCDTFNEMQMDNGTTDFIRSSGAAVYRGMVRADPRAVWLMQGWLFRDNFWKVEGRAEALLTSVETGALMVLDLDSTYDEHYTDLHSYYGQPFIFNDLNNFGGEIKLFGRVDQINKRIFQARNLQNGTMVGLGITPEGLPDSYLTTDLFYEMSYRTEPVDLKVWTSDYARRRYGASNEAVSQGWHHLLPRVFNSDAFFIGRTVLLTKLPGLNQKDPMPSHLPDIALAWDGLLNATNEFSSNGGFRYDLVDWTRDALVSLAPKYYNQIVAAFQQRETDTFLAKVDIFMNLLIDLETILASHEAFLLGNWLEQAKSVAGDNAKDAAIYEYNARNQITLWGPEGQILDYATKQWSGVVKDYYMPRWKLFFGHLMLDLLGKKKFRQDVFYSDFMEKIGKPFCTSRSLYPTKPIGDSIAIAKSLHMKWRSEMDTYPKGC